MVGKFAWGVKAKHCWGLSTNFWKQKVCWQPPAIFCLYIQGNFPAHNLIFHSRWRWWDWIQAIFSNLFYFTYKWCFSRKHNFENCSSTNVVWHKSPPSPYVLPSPNHNNLRVIYQYHAQLLFFLLPFTDIKGWNKVGSCSDYWTLCTRNGHDAFKITW